MPIDKYFIVTHRKFVNSTCAQLQMKNEIT